MSCDPLEILKRAFDAALAIKKSDQHFDAESDEELEAALRELIARFNGISDPKTLKDILWWPAYRCWLRIFSFQTCPVFRWVISQGRHICCR
jgi:hypothetical protein